MLSADRLPEGTAVTTLSMGASGESVCPIVMLLAEYRFGLKGQRKRRRQEPFKGRKLFNQTILNGRALRGR